MTTYFVTSEDTRKYFQRPEQLTETELLSIAYLLVSENEPSSVDQIRKILSPKFDADHSDYKEGDKILHDRIKKVREFLGVIILDKPSYNLVTNSMMDSDDDE